MRRRYAMAVLAGGLALVAVTAASARRAHVRAGVAASAPGDAPVYGVTVDRITHLGEMVASLAALPRRPTTRVYFELHRPASSYVQAVSEIHGVSGVMGELLDSSEETRISTEAFQERVQSYLQTLGSSVDVWEVGNEVNGNWTGPYAEVAAKLAEAYEDVAASGAPSALTLYANNFGPDNCGDGPAELTPVQFAHQFVPSGVADGLRYVLLSYYPTQCEGREPSSGEVASYMEQLHAIFPNASLGFGEVGLPRVARRSTLGRARQIMQWAYSLRPQLPYYVGGYFWWYGAEDALPQRSPLRAALGVAFEEESAALAPGAP